MTNRPSSVSQPARTAEGCWSLPGAAVNVKELGCQSSGRSAGIATGKPTSGAARVSPPVTSAVGACPALGDPGEKLAWP